MECLLWAQFCFVSRNMNHKHCQFRFSKYWLINSIGIWFVFTIPYLVIIGYFLFMLNLWSLGRDITSVLSDICHDVEEGKAIGSLCKEICSQNILGNLVLSYCSLCLPQMLKLSLFNNNFFCENWGIRSISSYVMNFYRIRSFSWNCVCLALMIPRFMLFRLKSAFRPKNAFICLCKRSLLLQA